MGAGTKIEWCDYTWNPWIGCTRVSPGCQHCYAEGIAMRFGIAEWGPKGSRKSTGTANWEQPARWDARAARDGVRRRVFCASMADLFEAHPHVAAPRALALHKMEQLQHLDWLVLTKRPENVMEMVPRRWFVAWPDHVWIGTSVENQQWADKRIEYLLHVPARMRFLSCEPLLGPVDLRAALLAGMIRWVIVGGESGTQARPMDLEWARAIRDQCRAAGVAFFMKQVGGRRGKGGELDAIPEDLRIREFPWMEAGG